jgi:hypothetical protein
VVGVLRPVVLLPETVLQRCAPAELEMILLHELSHVRRRDNLINALQRLAECLLFFQPPIWWLSRWARLEREQCCDAAVIAETGEPQRYARTLLSLAAPGEPMAFGLTGVAMSHSPLVDRIRTLTDKESQTMHLSRSVTVPTLGLLASSLLMLGVQAQAPAPLPPEPPAPPEQPAAVVVQSWRQEPAGQAWTQAPAAPSAPAPAAVPSAPHAPHAPRAPAPPGLPRLAVPDAPPPVAAPAAPLPPAMQDPARPVAVPDCRQCHTAPHAHPDVHPPRPRAWRGEPRGEPRRTALRAAPERCVESAPEPAPQPRADAAVESRVKQLEEQVRRLEAVIRELRAEKKRGVIARRSVQPPRLGR